MILHFKINSMCKIESYILTISFRLIEYKLPHLAGNQLNKCVIWKIYLQSSSTFLFTNKTIEVGDQKLLLV